MCTGSGPAAAFRQPPRVWLVVVGALVGYHACIYYATQQAPPAAAALLQGTTPLMIVLASGLLPGERLRWWHVAGAALGMAGVMLLIDTGGETPGDWIECAVLSEPDRDRRGALGPLRDRIAHTVRGADLRAGRLLRRLRARVPRRPRRP